MPVTAISWRSPSSWEMTLWICWKNYQIFICLTRMLLNVLMNSINYSPEHSSIILEVQPFDENSVRISVRDTGLGIPEKELPQLFKKYYRFPHKKNPKGHGLGLYICKVIT